ncbi:hypothetical protein GQR58_030528 [Nymphon striatum]|nr:hypothetical protein GQR58_030528 [Nymphon striatum]
MADLCTGQYHRPIAQPDVIADNRVAQVRLIADPRLQREHQKRVTTQPGLAVVGRRAGDVKPAIHQTIVAHMDADNFAHDHVICLALERDDLGHFAFQRRRRRRKHGHRRFRRIRWSQARRGQIHRRLLSKLAQDAFIASRIAYSTTLTAEHAGVADIAQGIFGAVLIGLGSG